MSRPFSNVRILDFTQVLAGPYGSYQLALLGADVIKVERTGGEDMRRTPLSREWADRGMAPSWLAINGNKKSLTLDFRNPAAVEIVRKLAAKADVVMENFRGGVMDRLGIGYKALSDINPNLIYCCISGFGQTGPYSQEAGYDGKIQALSGIMSITGHSEMGPTRAGFAVCDVLSGMTAAFAVSSALYQRTHTRKGQFIDVSMLEASLAFLSTHIADFTVAGHHQEQSGNQAISRKVTANLFRAKDSFLLLAVNDEKQYRALMTTLGRADVFDDPKFGDWFLRKENEQALRNHRSRLIQAGRKSVGKGTERGRRAVGEHLDDRGSHRSSADRGSRGHAVGAIPVRNAAADGIRLQAGAWRRAPRHCAAGVGGGQRRDPNRSGL
jgi:crotonobetainyl-CoA:carnitine CoA-transferase CaiB-like acyl-CoA transferase